MDSLVTLQHSVADFPPWQEKKKANDTMAPSAYFFHNFEQQDPFSQNSTNIMTLEATTNALKSSRGAVIITRYKHKKTLILFQSLSYMFRS